MKHILKLAPYLLIVSMAGVLMLLVIAHLAFFGIRTAHLLAYPFPLDYGEGPLLAQAIELLRGRSLWQLYGDPAVMPFLVVNYPPVYHALSWLLAVPAVLLTDDPARGVLLAGRLISLLSALGCVAALISLTTDAGDRTPAGERSPLVSRYLGSIVRLLIALAWLGIPIVREWASVMRVDLLGVCLGLWGLVLTRRAHGRWRLLGAAIVLALSLLTKPSLLAAPAAAFIWLWFRDWRRAFALAALTAAIGGAAVALLQVASGGWFWLHAVQSNANPWDHDLARAFWRDQLVIMRPLLLASALAIVVGRLVVFGPRSAATNLPGTPFERMLLPLYYLLCGLLTAIGVGKLGAYTNYFLEAYAGLFWLVAAGALRAVDLFTVSDRDSAPMGGAEGFVHTGAAQASEATISNRSFARRTVHILRPAVRRLSGAVAAALFLGLTAASLIRYYPLWSEEYLLPAGIIEGRNPSRVSIGAYGVWQDLQREQIVLAARGRINERLVPEVRAAGAPIYTDIPGVAVQAGGMARLQVFEHRMLLDIGLFDQRPLLRDLAHGHVPLILLDYLGNWMTSEQIILITRRYAQDLSVGTYSVYRPVETGPRTPLDLALPGGLRLSGIALTRPSDGGVAYGPGETPVVALDWRAESPSGSLPDVVIQLTDRAGRPLLEMSRPLLYGALAPSDWSDEQVQHLQPLALPPELPPGDYRLALVLRMDGRDLVTPYDLVGLAVAEQGGRLLGEQGQYVPASLRAEWERLGGYAGPGDPVTPPVPLRGGLQQCYKTVCLRLVDGRIERLPVGELTWLGEAGLSRIPGAPPEGQLSPPFQQLYDELGGEAVLGPLLGVEMKRFGDIVQYTRYARLERPLAGGPARLGNVGEDVLRLPGGTSYRWP